MDNDARLMGWVKESRSLNSRWVSCLVNRTPPVVCHCELPPDAIDCRPEYTTLYQENKLDIPSKFVVLCFGCFKTWREEAIRYCEYCKFHKEARCFHRVGACNMCWKYYNNHEKYRVPVVIPARVLANFSLNKDKLFY